MMPDIKKDGQGAVVTPTRDITAGALDELRQSLKGLLAEGTRDLVLDLKRVAMIDSQGLGLIIATFNSLNKSAGKLKVRNLSRDLLGLFQTMRLDQHFQVEPRPE
jgi:anti-anti-sigma factor